MLEVSFMRKKLMMLSADLFCYIAGSFIYSVAVTVFISSNEISPGGITGISTLVNHLFGLPVGIILLLLNIPIIIIGFIRLGGVFILKTSVVTVIVSLMLEITQAIFPEPRFEKILAALFGGILMGVGIGIIMLRGATTGGIDIIAKLINRRFRHLTVGRLILLMDAFIILLAALVYRNIESAMYSVVSMYACSYIMDTILYGADKGRMIYIVTEKPYDISDAIVSRVKRGVTQIGVKGGYTGESRIMLMCTVRINEVGEVYSIIREYDNNAFTVVSEAGEILGEGFKQIEGK